MSCSPRYSFKMIAIALIACMSRFDPEGQGRFLVPESIVSCDYAIDPAPSSAEKVADSASSQGR